MLGLRIIGRYPINKINVSMQKKWLEFSDTQSNRRHKYQVIKTSSIFNAFLDITGTEFNIMNINKNHYSILQAVVGFIYEELDTSLRHKYDLAKIFIKTLSFFCQSLDTSQFKTFIVSTNKVSEDVGRSIRHYRQEYNTNKERIEFYEGWYVINNEGSSHWLNLIEFYNFYGPVYTKKIYEAFSKMSIKESKVTLERKIIYFNSFKVSIVNLFPLLEDFKVAMNADVQHNSILTVYSLQLVQSQSKKYDLIGFHTKWAAKITVFQDVFIKNKLVPNSLVDLPVPEFKTSSGKKSRTRIDKFDKDGNAFNDKLITHVPLSYSDDQAKEAIFESIKLDIQHVVYHCEQLVEVVMLRYERFQNLKTKGKVKQLTKSGVTLQVGADNPVDMSLEENVCTTLNYHGLKFSCSDYIKFLGYYGKADKLNELLSIPTPYLQYPFLFLLIEQHPEITESWLLNWKLYDENGRKTGFKQVKQTWVAVSVKKRKGRNKEQQTVNLNDKSKRLVEQIIALTTSVRNYLKSQGSDSYRYMLINVTGVNSIPKRTNKILPFSKTYAQNTALVIAIAQESPYRNQQQAMCIRDSLTMTSMRASCGVRVYLETESVQEMSKALGHARYDPILIDRYLPKPLWDYFTNRWVRLFQNAIVYEAMKDSPYLLEAMDVDKIELELFLENHRLKAIPDIMFETKHRSQKIENMLNFDVAVLMVSPLLLQLFIAIIELVDANEKINEVAKHYYETAKFVLAHIAFAIDKSNKQKYVSSEIIEMYQFAQKTPLNQAIIQGVILC